MALFGLGFSVCNPLLGMELTHGTGVFYGIGDYGEDTKTVTRAMTAHLKFRDGPWSMKAATTLVSLSGPGSIDSDGVSERRRLTKSTLGIGDLHLTGSHTWFTSNRRGSHSLYGKIKFPMASESKGIGTGQYDEELGVEGAHGWTRGGVYGKAGYRWRGDRDDGELVDGGIYLLGAYKNISDRCRGGVSYEWRQAVRETSDPSREAMVYIERRNTQGRGITLYIIAGNSNASVDFAAGLEFAWRSAR